MRNFGKIWFLNFLWLLVSCSTLPPVTRKPFSLATFHNDQAARKEKLTRVEGAIDILLSGHGKRVSGGGRIWSEREKGARLEVRGPLGRTQFQLSLVGKELIAFYPTENIAYLDSSEGEAYAKEVFGAAVNLGVFRQLWLGILPFELKESDVQKLTPTERGWRGSFDRGKENWEVTFADDPPVVVNLTVTGSAPWAMTWEDFEVCCDGNPIGVSFGHATHATFGGVASVGGAGGAGGDATAKLSVEWDSIKTYPRTLGENFFPVLLPSNARKVVLK